MAAIDAAGSLQFGQHLVLHIVLGFTALNSKLFYCFTKFILVGENLTHIVRCLLAKGVCASSMMTAKCEPAAPST